MFCTSTHRNDVPFSVRPMERCTVSIVFITGDIIFDYLANVVFAIEKIAAS